MLIEFSVGNFLSIKDRQTLRLDASSISEHRDQLIDDGRYNLLRSAVIYGANASGKSNVLKAMATMRQVITTSAARSSTAEIQIEPFLLGTETENAPSSFEVLFLIDKIRYRYGFEVNRRAVEAEWLFVARKEREKPLFLRDKDNIDVRKDFKEGKGLEERTRDNALFLAVCDQFNGLISKQTIAWFSHLAIVLGVGLEGFRPETESLLADNTQNKELLLFLGQLNLGFHHIHVKDEPISKLTEDQIRNILQNKQYETIIQTIHSKGFVAWLVPQALKQEKHW